MKKVINENKIKELWFRKITLPCDYRHIRVKAEKGEELAKELRKEGFDAEFLGPGTAVDHSLNGGCLDPECCKQHVSYHSPLDWGVIETDAFGNEAHAIWKDAGLVKLREK